MKWLKTSSLKLCQSVYTRAISILIFIPASPAHAAYKHHRWELGIGDPSIAGWLAVALYVVTAFFAFQCVQQSKLLGKPTLFWACVTLLLTFLAINKQLDLQTLITQIGRDYARSSGLYAQRRALQALFIIGLLCVGIIGLLALKLKLRFYWREYRIVVIGLVLLFIFIMIRAASFHHLDALLRLDVSNIKLYTNIEILAISVILYGTLKWLKNFRLMKTYH